MVFCKPLERGRLSGTKADLRHNLVSKPAQKERRHLDVGDQAIAGPDLVAQIGEVLGRRHDAGNQLAHAKEGVLEDQAADVSAALVLGYEADAHGTAQALAVHDDAVATRLDTVTEVIEGGLGINVQAGLVGLARGDAVAAVLEHEDVAAGRGDQHAGYGQAVADVARVSVEHEHCHLGIGPAARTADVEG